MELHLVADTNLFFEFKTLEQLPWSELGADPILILLTKPVLDEIDKHKKGTGRTRDRAVEIFGRFRAMLEAGVSEVEIQASSPRVVLRRMTNVLPDPGLKDRLDYDKADERLIGIVAALNAQASGCDVKLFTDDGGPAGMALDLGVPFKMIDQAWRRPPGETTEAKRLKEVEKDLALYRSQEPKIAIRCDQAGQDKTVRVVRKVAKPLDEGEIDAVLDLLLVKHPEATSFAPPADLVVTEPSGDVTTTVYEAPSGEDVAAYRDVQRPAWIESCRNVLRSLHVGRDEPEPGVNLRWAMTNEGTRPALQVRVHFEAKGRLCLLRVRDEADDDEAEVDGRLPHTSTAQSPRLPPPPKPPAFGETITRISAPAGPRLARGVDLASLRGIGASDAQFKSAAQAMKGLDLMKHGRMPSHLDALKISGASRLFQDAVLGRSQFDQLVDSGFGFATPRFEPTPNLHRFVPEPHRPEAFYYSSWPAGRPVSRGALTCDSWRHQAEENVFEFEVVLEPDGELRGVVECVVHAHNLTKPVLAKVIVERKFESLSMLNLAKSLVDACR